MAPPRSVAPTRVALTSVADQICPVDVSSFVDGAVVDLYPGMGPKRNVLRPQNELRRNTARAEQTGGDGGTLQAPGAFRIPDTGMVDGLTNAFDRAWQSRPVGDGPSSNRFVEMREVAVKSEKIKRQKREPCF